jgi:Tol biopolymer transport system component
MSKCAVLVCLATTVLISPSADAQYFGRNKVQNGNLEFRTLHTEHFDIYYYPEEEQATRQAARMAERWYARYSELLDDTFDHRQVIVLYANHPDFSQTNVTAGSPGEGTGGFTEQRKSRIVLPFAAGPGETDHVLGHEIAHAFQVDIEKRSHQSAFDLPGWFIEGMAEYLSLGPSNAFTAMWMRDAAIHHRLPTLAQLDDPRYFPYRYGHALWSYLGERFGDQIVGKILRSKARGVLPRLEEATGLTRDELARDWHDSISSTIPDSDVVVTPRAIVTSADDGGRVHVAPAITPDGRQIMFVSERDRLSLDLFMADAASGQVLRKVISAANDSHLDSLQYIQSAGAWDPTGRHFVVATLIDGIPALTIVDTAGDAHRMDIRFKQLGEIYNPSWSPDGTQIVFSALARGFTDLFIYTPANGALQQITDDAFSDLHPAWSPDGKTIAFASDHFTTSLDDLRFGPARIALLDLATKAVRPLTASRDGKQISPQWAPDGQAIYFVGDPDGISNIFRVELPTGEIRQVTAVSGGIAGITATSPSLAVASAGGTLAFSAYEDGRYEIETLQQASAESAPIVRSGEGTPPLPVESSGALAQLLSNAHAGLPTNTAFLSAKYDGRLRLESIADTNIGTGVGGGGLAGGVLRATFGVTFGDMLGDRQLQTMFRAGTTRDDFAAQIGYVNQKGRLNWGFVGGYIPARFIGARQSIDRNGDIVTQEAGNLRYTHEFASLTARYNVSRASRFEFRGGVRRTGYGWQNVTQVTNITTRKVISSAVEEDPAGAPVYLAEMQAAYVRDTSVLGPTSPILGQRLRLDVEPATGVLTFVDVRLDARKYFMPVRPITFAVRVQHTGRYGPDALDPRLTPLLLGLQTLVRGYDLTTFAEQECGLTATSCSIVDQLTGNRFAVLNLELRAPLMGLLTGDLDYGKLPIEALVFADGAMLWTPHRDAPLERDRFRSVGAGVRANLGGFVMELTGVKPFDNPRPGWTASLLIRPGF